MNTSLSVNENDGDVITICAQVENAIQVDFSGNFEATIFTADLTAQGICHTVLQVCSIYIYIWCFLLFAGGIDFSAISEVFIFDIEYTQVDSTFSGELQCIAISISDDTVLENDEIFLVSLTSTDPSVNLNREFADVTIIDDDGMNTVIPC